VFFKSKTEKTKPLQLQLTSHFRVCLLPPHLCVPETGCIAPWKSHSAETLGIFLISRPKILFPPLLILK